jgi:heterodisulfide reductase subunit B
MAPSAKSLAPPAAVPIDYREDLTLLETVAAATAGVSRLEMCIQCGTCGGSCPSASDMDHTPRQLFAMLRAGMKDTALRSNTPWVCVSCYHCVVRCPQNVHITDVMYTLKAMAIRENLYQDSTAPDFSQTFIGMVETYGRSFEFGAGLTLLPQALPAAPARHGHDGPGYAHQETHAPEAQAHQGSGPTHGDPDARQRTGPVKMNEFLYYPGCSMEGSALAYHESLMAISGTLGLQLHEIADWNCCGATEYIGINLLPAYSLIARNLALASQQANGSRTIMAPCSACFLNLAKADHFMAERPALGVKVNQALAAGGLHYTPGSLKIRHLLDVIVNDVGLDKVRSLVVRPLKGLRIAPYLGCMVPRPDYERRWSNHEHPTELKDLMVALGAEVIDFPLATACCGGHMTQIGPETAFELIRRLISSADQYQADILVTVCPMCQMNLDAYQGEANRHFGTHYHMPIVFFTQMMALAFGVDAKAAGFGLELTSAKNALAQIGVEAPAPDTRKRKEEGLPMPLRPGKEK